MLSTPSSEYYSITDANNLLADVGNDSIFLFYCNIRSLPKNFELLRDLLYCFDNIGPMGQRSKTTAKAGFSVFINTTR